MLTTHTTSEHKCYYIIHCTNLSFFYFSYFMCKIFFKNFKDNVTKISFSYTSMLQLHTDECVAGGCSIPGQARLDLGCKARHRFGFYLLHRVEQCIVYIELLYSIVYSSIISQYNNSINYHYQNNKNNNKMKRKNSPLGCAAVLRVAEHDSINHTHYSPLLHSKTAAVYSSAVHQAARKESIGIRGTMLNLVGTRKYQPQRQRNPDGGGLLEY